ncbi:MAG TPA: sigma-54-dependent Fis family transcriptional regulator [Planctomycetota bacterium]|nr:sigma-54-dependent Fis family transcriptional regulator [Planctomycetota bacterium]
MPPSRPFADLLNRLRKGAKDDERARLTAILALNRALAKAGDLKALLTLLLDEAIALFGAERAFLVTGDGDEGGLTVEVARSLDKEAVKAPERKISRTIVARCMRERTGVFVADAREGDFSAIQSVADLKLRSVLCMPLLVGDDCLGCIYLDHRFQGGAFGADDVPWLQAFADQAAIAVHLHRLLAQQRAAAAVLAREKTDLERQVAAQAEELAGLRGAGRADLAHEYPEILGEAPALLRALHVLDRVVAGSYPVLLQGESGVGKELFARALHRHGPRSGGPLVAVNVAAIHEGLLESELFGHVRGAFTGADRDRKGLLREADGGILFLDEVSELGLDVQAKLLRFLEDGMVRPVGGEASTRVDLRIVAACNKPLPQAVAEGRFRADLLWRLAVVTIEVPPLRERTSDIPRLAEHFLAEAAREAGRAPRRLSPQCLEALRRRTWPGNVRQLRNEVLRLDALARGDVLDADLLAPEPEPDPALRDTLNLAVLERRAIADALRRTGGNKAEAARLLGISRRSLYNKLGE